MSVVTVWLGIILVACSAIAMLWRTGTRVSRYWVETDEFLATADRTLSHINVESQLLAAGFTAESVRTSSLPAHCYIYCWRCGQPTWAGPLRVTGTTSYGATWQYVAESATCSTPGCLHWDGTQATAAEPPTARELQDAAIAVMDAFWRRATETRMVTTRGCPPLVPLKERRP